MPTPDDPFAVDPERTVIRPMPGRRTEAPPAAPRKAAPPPVAPGPAGSEDVAEIVSAGINPVVDAGSPLIAMAVRLRGSTNQSDVPALRDRIVRELKRFEQTLRSAGLEQETLRTAHYVLCALIDDLVLNTPWSHQANWRAQTLTGVFHNDVKAGDRMYDPLLRRLLNDSGAQIDLLELMYLALSLGFEGKYRGAPNGPAELARHREEVYAAIRNRRGNFERELSPHWQGIEAAHKPLSSRIPLWVFGAASGVLLTAIFIGFSWALAGASNRVFGEMAKLPPGADVAIAGGTQLPQVESHLPRLREFLAAEISRGVVGIKEDDRTITISILGSGTFASGSANLTGQYQDVLQKIGNAIQNEPGQVTVSGHTDSTPISTVGFPSNFELSQARAEAARDVLTEQLQTIKDRIGPELSNPSRVVAEGRADTEPLPGATAEQNRRVEITLLKPLAG